MSVYIFPRVHGCWCLACADREQQGCGKHSALRRSPHARLPSDSSLGMTTTRVCKAEARVTRRQGKREERPEPSSDSYPGPAGATAGSKVLVPSIKSHKANLVPAGARLWRSWRSCRCQPERVQTVDLVCFWRACVPDVCAASTPNACPLVKACLHPQQPSSLQHQVLCV